MAQIPASEVFGFLDPNLVCNASTFACEDLVVPCARTGNPNFDFPVLWRITQNYYAKCPHGKWLFDPESATNATVALKNAVVKAIVGAPYKKYPPPDIWYRLTTWKFPLFQLIATSPRPPLSFEVELFTIVHLLGDPIGSIGDLLCKFESCQQRAIFWQVEFASQQILVLSEDAFAVENKRTALWKAFAIIADSYDEWGSELGDDVERKLQVTLRSLSGPNTPVDIREAFFHVCLTTGGALAADRSTKFLPVVVAQGFFIGAIAIAMIRTKSIAKGENPSTYINIEMHSIAFSALFFWLISAVIMTSVIGASQTAEAIPRILGRFGEDLGNAGFDLSLPYKADLLSDERIWKGGIYSWQPERSLQRRTNSRAVPSYSNSRKEKAHANILFPRRRRAKVLLLWVWPFVYPLLPVGVFAAAILTGMGISFAIPPIGWSCRSQGEMIIAMFWLGTYLTTFMLGKVSNRKTLFWITFWKDLVGVMGSMAMVVATQCGIYNKSDCYTKYGAVPLALPQQPATSKILLAGLQVGGSYTVIVTFGVFIQLVLVPSLLLWRYYAAFQVFLRRDDGASNLDLPRQWFKSSLLFFRWVCCCGWRKHKGHTTVANGDGLDEAHEMTAISRHETRPHHSDTSDERSATDSSQSQLLHADAQNRSVYEQES